VPASLRYIRPIARASVTDRDDAICPVGELRRPRFLARPVWHAACKKDDGDAARCGTGRYDMIRDRRRSVLVRSAVALLVALTLHAVPASAFDSGRPAPPPTPRDPPLDCTRRDNMMCLECGHPGGEYACCYGSCDIIIGPVPPPPAPSIRPGVIRKGLGSMNYFARRQAPEDHGPRRSVAAP